MTADNDAEDSGQPDVFNRGLGIILIVVILLLIAVGAFVVNIGGYI